MAYGKVRVDQVQSSTRTVDVDSLATTAVATQSVAGLLSATDKTKLDGVAAGAEVNVNADWTASSGDTQILNKPTLGTAAAKNVGTASGNVVELDGSARLPAVDGSQLTGINTAGTDLTYTAATRLLASSTGADATLPLFTNADAGLAPASSGGTANFLRADGTFAAPPGGSTDLTYTAATRLLSSSTGSGVTLPVFASGVAGLVPATSSGGTTTFLRADGTFATAGSPPGGSDTQVQFNDSGAFGGDADLTYNKTTNKLTTGGDVELNDGGTFTTTLQTVTPTANRTISFPNATGTVGLVGGSSGNLIVNQSGAYAGVANSSVENATGNITLGSRFISSLNGALSATGIAGVPVAATGTWIATGGTATTTKPQVLIEPTGATSTAWSTSGTGLGVNAASAFAGNLLDLQVNGTRVFGFTAGGIFSYATASIVNPTSNTLEFRNAAGASSFYRFGSTTGSIWSNSAYFGWSSTGESTGSPDLTLFRDAADILAQRRTTNAQASRVYGTFTDASNYVRAALSSTSTAVTLAAETAGTGADNIPLNLTAAGTGTIKVNSVAEVVVSSTVAGLPAAPAVGMLTRVTDATAPAVGVTVVGGGAAAALVWYNGANWSVIGV
jgi:hypothetical protein